MNNPRPDHQNREGYVSLLAMSFAFGLAVFGGALALGLRAYLAVSAAEQRDVLDRLALESAASEVLGRLAVGERHSIKPTQLADLRLNQRQVSIDLSLPEGKRDLHGDSDREILEALQTHGLRMPRDRGVPSGFETLGALSRGWHLSAAEEDCLRYVATVGRAPEEFRPEATAGDGEGLVRSVTAGDQVDLRLSLTARSRTQVLWTRVRFTGAVARPWQVHDYRRLSWAGVSPDCAPSNDITQRRTVHLTGDRSLAAAQ